MSEKVTWLKNVNKEIALFRDVSGYSPTDFENLLMGEYFQLQLTYKDIADDKKRARDEAIRKARSQGR